MTSTAITALEGLIEYVRHLEEVVETRPQGLFDVTELNAIRQWYNDIQDLDPKYLDGYDRLVVEKVERLLEESTS